SIDPPRDGATPDSTAHSTLEPVDRPPGKPGSDTAPAIDPPRLARLARLRWPIVAAISLIAGVAAAGLSASATRKAPLTEDLIERLKGSPNPAVIRYGRDGNTYVLVETPRDAAWVRQTLYKARDGQRILVRVEDEELARLEDVLDRHS